MAPNVIAKTDAMLPALRYLAAIELLTAAQAVDLRTLDHAVLGAGARAAYIAVRAIAPVLDEDRPLGLDVEALAASLAQDAWPTQNLLARQHG